MTKEAFLRPTSETATKQRDSVLGTEFAPTVPRQRLQWHLTDLLPSVLFSLSCDLNFYSFTIWRGASLLKLTVHFFFLYSEAKLPESPVTSCC